MPPPVRLPALRVNELKAALRQLGVKPGTWALALSGGPDSMALAALLAEIAPVRAFIVNHGLRPEAAAEARAVQRRARALGVKAHILEWEGDKPSTGLMAAARQARYRLLVEAAHRYHCTHLFLAHQRDDQIETVQMRAREGSGLMGLAGMPFLFQLGQVTLVRPVLQMPKARLVATCAARGLKAVDDPSNRNPRFARARLRLEKAPDGAAILAQQKSAAHHRQQMLDHISRQSGRSFTVHEGWAGFDPSALTAEILAVLLHSIGQEDKPIRLQALGALLAKVKAGQGATLAGCVVRNGLVAREAAAIRPIALGAGRHHIWWDRRWQLDFRAQAASSLQPLGHNTAWRSLRVAKWLESIPGAARAACPALWREGRLVTVLKGAWEPYYHPMSLQFEVK